MDRKPQRKGNRRSRYRWAAVLVALMGGLWVLARVPVSTLRGVDYVVSVEHLPLYLKALDFIDRDIHYGRLACSVTAGKKGERARVLALFQWTRANIRDVPAELPIVDDHIWYTIVRGYGTAEQKAAVFTTLSAYLGIPAYWTYLQARAERLPISLVKVAGEWRVLDVENDLVFRNRKGDLATAEEVAADPSLVAHAAAGKKFDGVPYNEYFRGFRSPSPPGVLPAYEQMLGRRLLFEAEKLVGAAREDGRPAAERN